MAKEFEQFVGTTSERAAEIILAGVSQNKPRILVGGDAKLLDWVQRLFPTWYDRVVIAMHNRARK